MHTRLFWSLLATSLTLAATYGAVAGVLVPAQIARADPANKEIVLAIVMTASSLLTLIVHPLAGAASDRTRSRWGRRAPWMLAGALGSAATMIALGIADAVWAIALGWLLLQPLLNMLEAPFDAVVADRVDARSRPRAASFVAAGGGGGIAVGAGAAGLGVSTPLVVYAALAGALVGVVLLFVIVNPDRSTTTTAPRVPVRVAWASRDLRLVFAGRFVLVLGQQLVMGYILYIVMAFSGASVDGAGATVSGIIVVHIVSLVIGAVVGARLVRGGRVPWILGATATIGVALLIPIAAPNLVGLLLYAIVAGLARGLYLSADLALMIDVLPSRGDSGRDLGVLGLATIVPQMLAPAVAGIVLTVSGNAYVLLFVLASVAAFASMPFIARVGALVSRRP